MCPTCIPRRGCQGGLPKDPARPFLTAGYLPQVASAARPCHTQSGYRASAAAPPAAAISTGHTTAEDVIVADLLACLKALEVPEGVLASIEAQRGSLRGAIAPRVTALRNSAYAQGFSAKASI